MAYARSLGFTGLPFEVRDWGTPVMLRTIEGAGGAIDAAGTYPLCNLGGASDLGAGLGALRAAGAVSVVLVADPLAGPGPEVLRQVFDTCRPFKTHHVLDRRAGPFDPSRHHRDRIRRGQRRTRVHRVSLRDPAWSHAWTGLYGGLVRRKCVTGTSAYCPAAFDALALLDDGHLTALAATAPDGETLAMQLWIRDEDRAYSHLTAASEAGRRSGASYALYAAAAEVFDDCRYLDFGGAAGVEDMADDGLAAFKRGFANAAVQAHLCCAVLEPVAYAMLSAGHVEDFFPRYRGPGG